jgi:hypothetical protein
MFLIYQDKNIDATQLLQYALYVKFLRSGKESGKQEFSRGGIIQTEGFEGA